MDSYGPFYAFLVTLFLFTLVVAAVTVVTAIIRRPNRWYGYALSKTGIIITTGILLKLIFPLHRVPPTVDGIAFAVGLTITMLGTIYICKDLIERTEREKIEKALHNNLFHKEETDDAS